MRREKVIQTFRLKFSNRKASWVGGKLDWSANSKWRQFSVHQPKQWKQAGCGGPRRAHEKNARIYSLSNSSGRPTADNPWLSNETTAQYTGSRGEGFGRSASLLGSSTSPQRVKERTNQGRTARRTRFSYSPNSIIFLLPSVISHFWGKN